MLSGPRLDASELLPLAFVQHYPFLWAEGYLLLGHNASDEEIWYRAYPAESGLARGRCYNTKGDSIKGKYTVVNFWQSWIDVFDITNRGLDRSHEYFTGVYLILQKFPNLRHYGNSKDVHSARRIGVPEYPFNNDHQFMAVAYSHRAATVPAHFESAIKTEEGSDTDETLNSSEKPMPSHSAPKQSSNAPPAPNDSAGDGGEDDNSMDEPLRPTAAASLEKRRGLIALTQDILRFTRPSQHKVALASSRTLAHQSTSSFLEDPDAEKNLIGRETFVKTSMPKSGAQEKFDFTFSVVLDVEPIVLSRRQMLHSLVGNLVQQD